MGHSGTATLGAACPLVPPPPGSHFPPRVTGSQGARRLFALHQSQTGRPAPEPSPEPRGQPRQTPRLRGPGPPCPVPSAHQAPPAARVPGRPQLTPVVAGPGALPAAEQVGAAELLQHLDEDARRGGGLAVVLHEETRQPFLAVARQLQPQGGHARLLIHRLEEDAEVAQLLRGQQVQGLLHAALQVHGRGDRRRPEAVEL